ncbi:MAG: hypothetical protein A3H97_01015 [Acidobacteria bacterium RIFCSPLOWO2_02_FULL_65_29]|nr:MAG: hypothetical protein A3H97_01015 [Acidobacteria bacterium RIFCSPLOWO2_02_FULL_65_29]
MNRKFFTISAVTLFVVLFNLGYVFHELVAGPWLMRQEAAIARDQFIIPLIALAFIAYSLVLAYLFPIYLYYYATAPVMPTAIRFGIFMGFVWDALQGGIIEVATFNMPFMVFVVDSGYHVFVEGTIAGLILGFVATKWPPGPPVRRA